MEEILTALKIGDLMMETDLTWQATGVFVVLIALGAVGVLFFAAKAVKAWRNALK